MSNTIFMVGLLAQYFVMLMIAGQYYKEHEHTFDADSEFVKKIRPGDRIILWARAMYPVS